MTTVTATATAPVCKHPALSVSRAARCPLGAARLGVPWEHIMVASYPLKGCGGALGVRRVAAMTESSVFTVLPRSAHTR